MGGIRITRSLFIPDHEIELRFSPSGGPGGQHANKAATRAEVVWNLHTSTALGPRQRQKIEGALRNRIDSAGNIRISSDRHRSQLQNRNDAIDRFRRLLVGALTPATPRVDTKPTRASKERRLHEKKKRASVKQNRKVRLDDF
jgi:ribosome-associated protein